MPRLGGRRAQLNLRARLLPDSYPLTTSQLSLSHHLFLPLGLPFSTCPSYSHFWEVQRFGLTEEIQGICIKSQLGKGCAYSTFSRHHGSIKILKSPDS